MSGAWPGLIVPALLVGCAVAYRPAQRELPADPPADAFDRIVSVLRVSYPGLEFADRERLRVRTGWASFERAGVPCRRRATVFIDQRDLFVVVESRVLAIDLWGEPYWSEPRGSPELEGELIEVLAAALQ